MKTPKEIAIEIFAMHEDKKAIDIKTLAEHSSYSIEEIDTMINDVSDNWEHYQNRVDFFDDGYQI